MLAGIPFWVFIVILFIFFSGYMAFQTMMQERRLNEKFIEKEGEVYMERMKEEKEKKEQDRERGAN